MSKVCWTTLVRTIVTEGCLSHSRAACGNCRLTYRTWLCH